MYLERIVAVVMPVCNEEKHIEPAIRRVPELVDLIVVVDDGSSDNTWEVLNNIKDTRIVKLRHNHNRGVGAATKTGYRYCLQVNVDLIAVMALAQVLFNRLVGNGIQFAIQITIHQFYSFFAVHLFLLTDPSCQTFLKFVPCASQPRHDRTQRNLRDVGYLLVGETFLMSQRQDLTELGWQFIHCLLN